MGTSRGDTALCAALLSYDSRWRAAWPIRAGFWWTCLRSGARTSTANAPEVVNEQRTSEQRTCEQRTREQRTCDGAARRRRDDGGDAHGQGSRVSLCAWHRAASSDDGRFFRRDKRKRPAWHCVQAGRDHSPYPVRMRTLASTPSAPDACGFPERQRGLSIDSGARAAGPVTPVHRHDRRRVASIDASGAREQMKEWGHGGTCGCWRKTKGRKRKIAPPMCW